MADLFISYSRKDLEFVRALHAGLQRHELNAWVDWEGIPPSALWLQEIFAAIDNADVFLFVISPDSVASRVGRQEIEHAVARRKRIVPVVYRPVEHQLLHPSIAQIHTLSFVDADFEQQLEALVAVINTDYDWARTHTRLLVRALEWESKRRDPSLLLRGSALREAEAWLGAAEERNKPQPTGLHRQYIYASQREEHDGGPRVPVHGPPPRYPLNAAPGTELKGYVLEEPIGSGAFGTVYRAIQPGIGREVAVKIIRPEYANQPDFIRRFEAEAQFVARLEHPHIVPLYDYWRDPSGAYLVMRWVRGGSLQAALAAGTWSLAATTHLLEQIGPALLLAHRQGVIHRDVKPTNILLDEDRNAYLADFGIAKDLGLTGTGEQTVPGTLIGSPSYLTPEQIQSDPVGPPTDVYSLGLVLYEMLSGQPAFRGSTPLEVLDQQLHAPLPPLLTLDGDVPESIHEVLARATAKRPEDRYPDMDSLVSAFRLAAAGDAASRTALLKAPPAPSGPNPENPYKGLRAFAEADARNFFGREALTGRLLARLQEPIPESRFLAVVGPSGSGKSSAVLAGLLPAVRSGALPGADRWFVQNVIPGAHPFEELEAALLRVAVNPPASLLAQLQEDPRGLLRAVKRVLPDDPATELLLVIDQFEEVFTLVADEATRAHLLASLEAAVTEPRSRLRVVVTLRADFYDRPLLYPTLGELLRQRTEVVLPLTVEELERAIIQPAQRVGVGLEPELVATIVRDVGEQPGTLPLLQYALTELFAQRVGRTLIRAEYQRTGGVLGALGRRAEEIYTRLEAGDQVLTRQLFLRLVTLGEGVEDTRRRVRQSELAALGSHTALERVLQEWGRYRLLTFDRDPVTREPTIEVAHEALLRTWGRLHEWLAGSRADLRIQRQLLRAASEWAGAGQERSFLTQGVRLEQFAALAAESSVTLNAEEQAYVAASLAEQEQQAAAERVRQEHELILAREAAAAQRTATNRLRVLVGALAVFLLVALSLVGVAVNSQTEANAQREIAVRNARTAVANQNEASAQRATAVVAEVNADAQRATAVVEGSDADAQRATAEARRQVAVQAQAQAEAGRQLAQVQALAAQANAQLDRDPELSVLLALEAISTTARVNDPPLPQAVSVLHLATQRSQVRLLLTGHTDDVIAAAFSPDGKTIVTASADKTARVWDVATGQPRHILRGHTDAVWSAVYSPDGQRILTASRDGTARIWDATTGQVLLILQKHTAGLNGAVWSPDGRRILTVSRDGTARLWDATTGEAYGILPVQGPTPSSDAYWQGVIGGAFSPDSKTVVTTGVDGTARVWDAVTRQQRLVLRGHTSVVITAAFSPDGKHIVTASDDGTAKVWNAGTGQAELSLNGHTDTVRDAAYSPDGVSIITASDDKTVKIWDATTGTVRTTLYGHRDQVRTAVYGPEGRFIVTANKDATAEIWAAAQEELPSLLGHTDVVQSAAYSPDGRSILTASSDTTARIWDATTGQVRVTLRGHTEALNAAAWSPDGQRVVTASSDKTGRIWDVASGKTLFVLPGHTDSVHFAAWSPNGRYVVTTSADSTAGIWDTASGQERALLHGYTTQLWGAAWSPDSQRVVAVSDDPVVRVWDAATGKVRVSLTGHTGPVASAEYSPDGRQIVTAGDDQTARIWDAATGQEQLTLRGHTDKVLHAWFSPDGRNIITISADKTAKIWNAATGREQVTLRGHTEQVVWAAYSPDGRRVATASDDSTAKVWDSTTGQELTTLAGHSSGVYYVAWSPDGQRIVTASADGTARQYVANLTDLLALAQNRITRSLTPEERALYVGDPSSLTTQH